MSGDLESAWIARARGAVAWREGESIEPVLEALALAVALEATGLLPEVPPSLRDEVRRVGQRALLHLSAEIGGDPSREEALRDAASYARDGLRALSGKPPTREGAGREGPEREQPGDPPSPRELARLIAGTAEPLEAASIARRARASEQARKELAWALRLRRGEADVEVRLAAEGGEAMRDPASGRHLASIRDGDVILAEVFAFGGGALAIYAASGEPVRLEAPGVRTDAMQAGYWGGHAEGDRDPAAAIEGTLHVGERRFAISVRVD